MATAPRSQRRQQVIDRLTALLPSSQTFRRWLQSRTPSSPIIEKPTPSPPTPQQQPEKPSSSPSPPSLPLEHQPQQPEKPSPSTPPTNDDPPTNDALLTIEEPLAPTAYRLPGLTNPSPPLALLTPSTPTPPSIIPATVPVPFTHKPFIPPPPSTPDLLLTALPLDVLLLILEQPVLSLEDLLALRETCASLRRVLPYRAVEKKLTVRNYEGWRVVFEMGGNKYPGTTYGNRRLCGRCVLPRCRGGLVVGEKVGEMVGVWPGGRGMCFPCLWTVVVQKKGEEGGGEGEGVVVAKGMKVEEMARLAGISTKEEFLMLDGSRRRMCEKCCRDIHVNAVPCPHCTDFSEWCRARRTHG